MEYGKKVIIKDRPDLPVSYAYAGAEAVTKPCFVSMDYYAGMENFLCLEIVKAADTALIGKTIYLHSSAVEEA